MNRGTVKNRMGFSLEVISDVTKKTGGDVFFCVRLSAADHIDGAITQGGEK
jgi:2,4-dienoyl-CoA reductase-like NADH-dependent reductase (Old Yellow Enzyme family)